MKTSRLLALLAVLLTLGTGAACSGGYVPHPVEPAPPAPRTTCATMCAHQRELRCKLGEPTPAGGTCEDWCENARRNAAVIRTDCLATEKVCGECRAAAAASASAAPPAPPAGSAGPPVRR